MALLRQQGALSVSESLAPDAVYPALEGPSEKNNDFELPGQGVPAEGCGKPIPLHCNDHDGPVWGSQHCDERSCPRCYERWCSQRGHEASLRISWGAKFWQDKRFRTLWEKNALSPLDPAWLNRKVLVGHFMVSMPDNLGLWIRGWCFEKARALAYEIARRHGVAGGAAVFHPWRRDDQDLEYIPDGYWHFHIVGIHFMPTRPGGTDFAPDGQQIIFKHIKDDEYENYGGLRSGEAIARLISYQLSHAGLRKGSQAITYFGLLSSQSLPKSAIHETYPEALDDGSKTNPRRPTVCPACGGTHLESCTESAWIPAVMVDKARSSGVLEVVNQVHPEPDYEPTPEEYEHARTELEERFQILYDEEPDPTKRHQLTKERQSARMELARRESELLNMKNPLVAAWVYLKSALEDGSKQREYLFYDTKDREARGALERCIELSLKTGRLRMTPGGRLYLAREYGLDDALRELREIVQSGEARDGQDSRLERLFNPYLDEDNPIMSDTGFVFGSYLEAARRDP